MTHAPSLRTAGTLGVLAVAALVTAGCAPTASDATEPSGASSSTVTVYTADGLNDGDESYYQQVFAAFTAETGIEVQVVEGGSGEVLQRVAQEKSNTQADILVTLPPFIQSADEDGLLVDYVPEGSQTVPADAKDADGAYTALLSNYIGFIRNTAELDEAPRTWDDLLDPAYQGLLQYSTPGIAGDGTAMLMLAREVLGDQESTEYFEKLQVNNVGPSDSTGQLAAKVDKGELLIANGDVQMNYAQSRAMPNLGIFFLEGTDGTPTTLSVPYYAGLVAGAPHEDAAKKLLDYLYTPEAQELATTAGGGFPARDDITPTGEAADALAEIMSGVTVLYPDWMDISENLDEYVQSWNTATGTL
ncbi:2-aminoethylphosphonate ABC transporter substrate-binding protein [Microbacterium sp. W1N]|uniref:2-aminoethylphosphonate ABC transporter substrate-binding protein n=1 Tax=Microbacterium festucae TaxID=2977531 RepID=UPI0021C14115|nr:2-aminoethylphosphonate ABC transporter substrate-binding protein [Microbacterium festucae]MCT9820497.1 2-aminoethylphosphonate ABC transporter substrate-binding protein [Microbacterium festucae]